jgi:hypothetical protein
VVAGSSRLASTGISSDVLRGGLLYSCSFRFQPLQEVALYMLRLTASISVASRGWCLRYQMQSAGNRCIW